MKKLILFLSAYLFGITMDLIWLRLIAHKIYAEDIGPLLRRQGTEIASNIPSALLVYAVLSFGIIYLVLPKAQDSYKQALIAGASFGIVVYGIYDFSNYAMLAHWPLTFTLIDLSWGIILCTLTSCFSFFIHRLQLRV